MTIYKNLSKYFRRSNETKVNSDLEIYENQSYLSRENYINQASPIEADLLAFYSKDEAICIFDIGSCEGEDSIKYAKIFPNAKIFAFEALQENVDIICRQSKKYNLEKNIRIHKSLLSNKSGELVKFYVSSGCPDGLQNSPDWNYGNKSSSLLPPSDLTLEHYSWLKFDKTIEIETETINDFCYENDIGNIDFLHMDVQGAELKVLEGAGDLIEKIGLIWMEVEKVALYENQPLVDDVEQFMKSHGFVKVKDTVAEITGDQLYVNERIHKTSMSNAEKL